MDNLSKKVINCKNSIVFLRDDGILQVEINDDTYFDIDDAKELIAAAGEIGKGKKFLNLIIAGKGVLVDAEARQLSSSKEGAIYKLADAFVINSLAQQLIANFIIKAQKPPVPTSFFKEKEKAIEWLRSLKL